MINNTEKRKVTIEILRKWERDFFKLDELKLFKVYLIGSLLDDILNIYKKYNFKNYYSFKFTSYCVRCFICLYDSME